LALLNVAPTLALAQKDEIGVHAIDHGISTDDAWRGFDLDLERVQAKTLLREIIEPSPVGGEEGK
jgi:hypothetical protein